MLIFEILAWTKKRRQDKFFLKLNFLKDYNRMNWNFLLITIVIIEFPLAYFDIVKITLLDKKAMINAND